MPRPKMSENERREIQVVRDYLKALENNKPKRGRKRTPKSIRTQIASTVEAMDGSTPTKRLELVQKRINLETELESLAPMGQENVENLQKAFTKVAASYSGKRGISYAAWREIGVSANVLKDAGIRHSN